MSHWRAQRFELRAIFAAAAVCALVFALLVSGAQQGARGEGSMQIASDGDVHHAMCHYSSFEISKDATRDGGGQKKQAGCPCCLATHTGAAVLPERTVASIRCERPAIRALYTALVDAAPHSAAPSAVNGARAPPNFSATS